MASIGKRCRDILGWFKGSPSSYPLALTIPPAQMLDSPDLPLLKRHEDYFAVRLNHLGLAQNRSWWVQVEPMAFMVTEFQYGGERMAVPFVVGPSLIERFGQPIPQGMLFDDTVVVGLHPYVGGRISMTAILYQIPRSNEARRLLSLVETAAGLFGSATALGAYLKAANVMLEGVESLLGLNGVQPIAGRRHELDPDLQDDLGTGYFALMEGDRRADDLVVEGRRLRQKASGGKGVADLSGADFLLYSLVTTPKRSDVEMLPFHRAVRDAEELAHADASKDGWERAKAVMVQAFTQIIDSPDLTRSHGDALRTEYRQRLSSLHQEAQANALMAPGDEDEHRAHALVEATSLLEM